MPVVFLPLAYHILAGVLVCKVCLPCWQIAANFGGACPTCGWAPDADTIRERANRYVVGRVAHALHDVKYLKI